MNEKKTANIVWHKSIITRQDKEKLLGQKGVLLWFTGLSAAGKSTIAHALEERLFNLGYLTAVLDGDNIRHGLNKDLGFSIKDREDNIRRIGEVAKLFVENGIITMAAFISPYRRDRDRIRADMKEGDFIEIYVACPLEELERRDPKEYYKKARGGLIKGYTGIDAPYEEPSDCEIILNTSDLSLQECVDILINYLYQHNIVMQR
ncbi:MAG: adenylyl-sulfate kinase [Nitrospirota bacterium]